MSKALKKKKQGGSRKSADRPSTAQLGRKVPREPSLVGGVKGHNMKRNYLTGKPRPVAGKLHKLIEEATVDCYNESEEVTGIFTMLEENLAVPFTTKLLGTEVTVERVDLNKAGEIVAICRPGGEGLRGPLHWLALTLTRKGRNGLMHAGNGLNGGTRCLGNVFPNNSALCGGVPPLNAFDVVIDRGPILSLDKEYESV